MTAYSLSFSNSKYRLFISVSVETFCDNYFVTENEKLNGARAGILNAQSEGKKVTKIKQSL